jgi:5-methyltetrahydrofolate--homocysteine methyltransferase
MSVLQKIADAVLNGDEQVARQGVQNALAENQPARQILDQGLLAGMTEVGRRFREGEYFLPEVLIAAQAMKEAMEVLRPALLSQGVRAEARAVVGTVRGDLHDIGKNLLAVMLESAGFEVEDLGVDVSPEQFIEACRRKPVQLVAMSALLTTTMVEMQKTVSQIRQSLAPPPKIIIGGAPVTQEYADAIRADGYGRDAATGADVAKRLCMSL